MIANVILVVIQGILLPILDKTTIEFLHQILNDEKEMLMKSQTDSVDFPGTPECRLEKMMEMIDHNPRLKKWFPDTWTKPSKVDKKFMVAVLSTLCRDTMI